MSMITRRQFLASSAAYELAITVPSLISASCAWAASSMLRRVESRIIDVGGGATKIFGLAAKDGMQVLALKAHQEFRVCLANALDVLSLTHWHELTSPRGLRCVPGHVGLPLPPPYGHGMMTVVDYVN